jgi:hypothetical protein
MKLWFGLSLGRAAPSGIGFVNVIHNVRFLPMIRKPPRSGLAVPENQNDYQKVIS